MALQLVYTSAPKLLDAGRSGFGVVARSKNLPPLAANAIERFSKFANMQGTDRSRIVLAHRKVTIGNTRLHVLSRIRDSGSDHTGRTNHIAHHLIFSPLEIRQAAALRLTPADVFAQFAWLDRWEGAPRAFDGSADVQIGNFIPQFAATQRAAWVAATGEPLHSRLLAWDGAPKSGALILPDGIGISQLLGEALAECQNPWEKTFTTSLEPTDELAELDWVIAYRSDSSAISRVSSRAVFDISRPHDLPVPAEAALPQPDTRAAASNQDTATPSQGRVLPPPDLSPRPIHAQTINPASQEPRKSGTTAVPNTRQTGNGKLWAIIGGGIAALFLLLVTALFLMNTNKTKRAKAAEQTRKKDELAQLISGLTGQGVSEPDAKRILDLSYDNSVIQRLPDDISTLKVSIKELGAQIADNGSPAPALEKFEKATKGIADLEKLPGSLCKELWGSLAIIRKLHRGDTSTKSPTETLGELKSSLQRAATLTDPEWIKQEEIDRIYSILWEWKYVSMVGDLVDGKNSVTVKAVEEFVDKRLKEIVSDERHNALLVQLDEPKRNIYVEKLRAEKSKLLAMLDLLPKQTQPKKDQDTPAPPTDKPEKTANQPIQTKLEDEEWCVVDPNKSGSFQIDLSNSKIIQAIKENDKEGKALYFFDKDKPLNFGDFGDEPRIEREGNKIKSSKRLSDDLLKNTMVINYNDANITIHFNTPQKNQNSYNLNGRFERIPGSKEKTANYRLIIEGEDLIKIEDIRSKIIPYPELIFQTRQRYVYTPGEKITIEGFKPGVGDFEKPSLEITKILKEIFDVTIIKDEKDKEIPNPDKKISEKSWREKGWGKFQNDESTDSKKWIQNAIRIKMGDSYRLENVKRIQGKNLSDLEIFVVNTLRSPIENHIPPEKINTIQAIISVDNKKIMDANIKITYK